MDNITGYDFSSAHFGCYFVEYYDNKKKNINVILQQKVQFLSDAVVEEMQT
jgi:hypothetical protein